MLWTLYKDVDGSSAKMPSQKWNAYEYILDLLDSCLKYIHETYGVALFTDLVHECTIVAQSLAQLLPAWRVLKKNIYIIKVLCQH